MFFTMYSAKVMLSPIRTQFTRNRIVLRHLHKSARPSVYTLNVNRCTGSLATTAKHHQSIQYLAPCTAVQWHSLRGYSSGQLPDHFPVALPALSPTMESGTIVRWTKQEGDQINEGDLLAEIETDKATMGFETPEEGFLAKILIEEGAKDVPIGKLMCVIVSEQSDIAAFADFTGDAASADASATSGSSASAASSSGGDFPPYMEMLMPAQSPTMTHGDILSWEKKEGEECHEGDVLLRVKTDKADIDVECPEDAFLAKILVPAGTENVPLGQLLCVFVEDEKDLPKFANFTGPVAPAPSAAAAATSAPSSSAAPATPRPAAPVAQTTKPGGRILATPFAKKLAAEKGIDLGSIRGSGPDGQVRASDVEEFVPMAAAPIPATAPSGSPPLPDVVPIAPGAAFQDMPLSSMRKVIANRLMESKSTIPHYYLSVDVCMDAILKLRRELNTQLTGEETKLSVNDFVVKAAALACRRVPEANSSWQGEFIRQYNTVEMSIAVATDNGLITPIVTRADTKGLASINADVKRLATKAKEGTLHPSEFQGGTFTISNLGMFGVKNFSAIINPPQACILAVGGAEKRLVPDEDSEKGYRAETVMSVTLSCDHRVVDGAVGATWLQHFRRFLEKPSTMLL